MSSDEQDAPHNARGSANPEALEWYARALEGSVETGSVRCFGPGPESLEVQVRLSATGYSIFPADYDDPALGSGALASCREYFDELIEAAKVEAGEPPRVDIFSEAERISNARYLWRMATDEVSHFHKWYWPAGMSIDEACALHKITDWPRAPFTLAQNYLESRAITGSERFANTVIGVLYGGYCGWDGRPGSPRGYGDFELTEANMKRELQITIDYMIAAMRNILTDELTAVHRTCFKRIKEGLWMPMMVDVKTGGASKQKKLRQMPGIASGAAVKFHTDAEVRAARKLIIGEGVETCLSAIQMGLSPVWATGSTYGIRDFPALPFLRELTVLGERDNGASERAYREVQHRYRGAGIKIKMILPEKGYKDFNDQIQARQK
ncbi:MAG: toprim domain-containing protein [Methylocella sp.]